MTKKTQKVSQTVPEDAISIIGLFKLVKLDILLSLTKIDKFLNYVYFLNVGFSESYLVLIKTIKRHELKLLLTPFVLEIFKKKIT